MKKRDYRPPSRRGVRSEAPAGEPEELEGPVTNHSYSDGSLHYVGSELRAL